MTVNSIISNFNCRFSLTHCSVSFLIFHFSFSSLKFVFIHIFFFIFAGPFFVFCLLSHSFSFLFSLSRSSCLSSHRSFFPIHFPSQFSSPLYFPFHGSLLSIPFSSLLLVIMLTLSNNQIFTDDSCCMAKILCEKVYFHLFIT